MNRTAKRNAAAAIIHGQVGIRDDPFDELANAIVISAANDYRSCCQRRKRLRKQSLRKQETREALFNIELKIGRIEQFFKSDWCFALSGGTNIAILERLQKEQEV